MQDKNTELLTADIAIGDHGVTVLRLTGEVDISSAHVLTRQFEILAKDGVSRVIIDATNVTFMDSTGLHVLVEGKRLIHQSGAKIVLVPSFQVRRVLELVFPDPLFAARVDSLEEAMRAIGDETSEIA